MVARTRARFDAGDEIFFDGQTFETVEAMTHLFMKDDFLGARMNAIPSAATAGESWIKKIVHTSGTVTVAGVSNGAGGQVQCTLDATSEKQDAVFYFGDQLVFDVTKGLVFEARAQLPVLPSAAGVQAVFGLAAAWVDGPDNIAEYLNFGANGSGLINCRSQDGTTQKNVSSGITLGTTDWHVFRIDATDVTNVKYFIDGAQVASSTTFPFSATGSSAILQMYASAYKPSGTGVGTLGLDYMGVWGKRV